MLFGIALAGGTAVTLSTFSTRDELDQLLQLFDVGVLLTHGGIVRRSRENEVAALVPALPLERYPFLRRIAVLAGGGHRATERWEDFVVGGDTISDALLDARNRQ
jgi:fatty-acyl-CoA synthase